MNLTFYRFNGCILELNFNRKIHVENMPVQYIKPVHTIILRWKFSKEMCPIISPTYKHMKGLLIQFAQIKITSTTLFNKYKIVCRYLQNVSTNA